MRKTKEANRSIRRQAAETLLRARSLPRGPHRNDLRQLGVGLLKLHRLGLNAKIVAREEAIATLTRQPL